MKRFQFSLFLIGFPVLAWLWGRHQPAWVHSPYLSNGWLKTGYQATNVVFTLLPLLYGWTAVMGGGR